MTKKIAICDNSPCERQADVVILHGDSNTTSFMCRLCYDAFAWGHQSPNPTVTWLAGRKPYELLYSIDESSYLEEILFYPEVENA